MLYRVYCEHVANGKIHHVDIANRQEAEEKASLFRSISFISKAWIQSLPDPIVPSDRDDWLAEGEICSGKLQCGENIVSKPLRRFLAIRKEYAGNEYCERFGYNEDHGILFEAKSPIHAILRFQEMDGFTQLREWAPEEPEEYSRQPIVCNKGSEYYKGVCDAAAELLDGKGEG